MKRDWDLIREILICIEEQDRLVEQAGAWSEERGHHVKLLLDAGFVAGIEPRLQLGGTDLHFTGKPRPSLTWHGHDFLDAIRDDTVWKNTKERAAKVGGRVTLAVLTQLATYYLKEKLGINQ